ncbi:MAG: N-acetyltransferase [Pseudomonadota bacterium]
MRERPMPPDIVLRPERPTDEAAVESLYTIAFGPGRFSRTAYRMRMDGPHDASTSFVADRNGLVIGAIRQSRICVGDAPAYLLGPLAVAETAAKQGIGRALLDHSIKAASQTPAEAIVLVGDHGFYGPSGFHPAPQGALTMPGPVESHRLLVHPLRTAVKGPVTVGGW